MKIKDFTPIFDSVVRKYDPYTALVYGKIWRICDWSEMSICTMSNERIAAQLGISEKTVRRKKELLEGGGLIRKVGRLGETDTVTVCHDVVLSLAPDFEGLTADFGGKGGDAESDKESIKKRKEDTLMAAYGLSNFSDFSNYPAVQDKLDLFMSKFPGIEIKNKSMKAKFVKQAEEDLAGFALGEIGRMCDYAIENDWKIIQPKGIVSAYNMLKSETESDPYKGANIVT